MASLGMGEAQRRIVDYLSRFSAAIIGQDGSALKPLFVISDNSSLLLSLADGLSAFQDASRLIEQSDSYTQIAEIVTPLLRCIHDYRIGRFVDAYNAFERSASAFLQEFRMWKSAWALEAVYTIAYEIRVLAERADIELASSGKNPEKLKGAGSFLMRVFGALTGKGPKRVGALYVACQLFKVYFKLGTVHLCKSVIRSVETALVFDFEEFPVRDKVTYKYYTGRLEVWNENFLDADQRLTYAFVHCNPQHEANIRKILKYLIPAKLSIGVLPQKSLLENYNLIEYADVVEALRRGDPHLFQNALQEHEDRFLRSGVYLGLAKLELQVYQRLVKKIYIIQKKKDPHRAHHLKLDVIIQALKQLKMDMDVDEVVCIVAMLIYRNLMKGYCAYKSKVIVLSKQDPFPKLIASQ